MKIETYKNHLTSLLSDSETLSLNPLQTKRSQFYLKTQFVPRSKHFSSGL